MSSEPWSWSASELAHRIRNNDISSREAVLSCLSRIDQVNPKFNAIVELQVESALAAADDADRAVRSGQALGILHGVPITTKINVDQAGSATSNGVKAYAHNLATADSPVVANLRSAGAVIVGRTNTPAFSMRWYTDNDLHGRTLNPWAADRTPGGSSGGAAVAVSQGMCAIAHGNDGGGSLRYPSYCTGTVGLRPSFGRVPAFNATTIERQLSMQWISVQGAITRNVADAQLALQAMISADSRDPWHVPLPFEWTEPLPRKIALCFDPAGVGMHASVRKQLENAAAILMKAGYQVEEKAPPDVAAAAQAWNDHAQGEARINLMKVIQRDGDDLSRRAFELMMNRTPHLDVHALMQISASRATFLRRWQIFMASHPLVLCPVAMEPALPYGVDTESDASVDRLYRSHVFLFATAYLGLPCVSVPTGMVDGIPYGRSDHRTALSRRHGLGRSASHRECLRPVHFTALNIGVKLQCLGLCGSSPSTSRPGSWARTTTAPCSCPWTTSPSGRRVL